MLTELGECAIVSCTDKPSSNGYCAAHWLAMPIDLKRLLKGLMAEKAIDSMSRTMLIVYAASLASYHAGEIEAEVLTAMVRRLRQAYSLSPIGAQYLRLTVDIHVKLTRCDNG